MNLSAFLVGPGLVRKLRTRMHHDPSTQRTRRQNESPTAARSTYDPAALRIERSRAARRRAFPAVDAAIEGWRKPEQGEDANVEGQECFLGRRPRIQCRQETHGDLKHCRLWLVVRYALTNHSQRGTRRPNGREVAKDVEEGSIDRYALQMSELTAPWAEVGLHDDVRLKRATKPTLASSRTPGKRCDLSVVLGQECDDSIGVAIVDGAQE